MRPVTICRLGNSFIMVLATHGSQKEPQGGKRHQKVSTWGVRKARQKAIKIILITTPVYFHLKRGIQTPPSTADKGNRNHIFFQEKKKNNDVGTVAGEQPPALSLYNEGSMPMGPTHSGQSAGRILTGGKTFCLPL